MLVRFLSNKGFQVFGMVFIWVSYVYCMRNIIPMFQDVERYVFSVIYTVIVLVGTAGIIVGHVLRIIVKRHRE